MLPKLSKFFKSNKSSQTDPNFLVISVDQENITLGYFESDGVHSSLIKAVEEERTADLFRVIKTGLSNLAEGSALPQRLILGISEPSIETMTTIARLNRDNNQKEVASVDIEKVLTQVGTDYDSGVKELFFSAVTSTVLDGLRVSNPVGVRGNMLELGCFNAYMSKERLDYFDNLSSELELDLEKIVPTEYAIVRSFLDSGTKDGILIKVLKEHTSVSFVEESNIVGIKSFSLGLADNIFWATGLSATLEEFTDQAHWPTLLSFYDTPKFSELEHSIKEKLPVQFPELAELNIEDLNERLSLSHTDLVLNSLSNEEANT